MRISPPQGINVNLIDDNRLYLRSQNYLRDDLDAIATAGADSGTPNTSLAFRTLYSNSNNPWQPAADAVNPWLTLIPRGIPLRVNRIRVSPTTKYLEAQIPILIMHEPGGVRSNDISIEEHATLIGLLNNADYQPIWYSELIDWVYKGIYPTVAEGKKPIVIHYDGCLAGVQNGYVNDLSPLGWRFNVTVGAPNEAGYLTTAQLLNMIAVGKMQPHVYLKYNTATHNPGLATTFNEYGYPLWNSSIGREHTDIWQQRLQAAYDRVVNYIRHTLGYAGDLVMCIPGSQNTIHMFQAAQRNGVRMAVNGTASTVTGAYPGIEPFSGSDLKGAGCIIGVPGFGNGTYTPAQIKAMVDARSIAPSSLLQTVDVYVPTNSYNIDGIFDDTANWRTNGDWLKVATLSLPGHAAYDQIPGSDDLEYPVCGIRLDITSATSGGSPATPSIGQVELFYESDSVADFARTIEQNSFNLARSIIQVPPQRKFYFENDDNIALDSSIYTHTQIYTIPISRTGFITITGYMRANFPQATSVQCMLYKDGTDSEYFGDFAVPAANNVYVPISYTCWVHNEGVSEYEVVFSLSTGTGTIKKIEFSIKFDGGPTG